MAKNTRPILEIIQAFNNTLLSGTNVCNIELIHDIKKPTLELDTMDGDLIVKQSMKVAQVPLIRKGFLKGRLTARYVTRSSFDSYNRIVGKVEFANSQEKSMIEIPLDTQPQQVPQKLFTVELTELEGDFYPVLEEDLSIPVIVENDIDFVECGFNAAMCLKEPEQPVPIMCDQSKGLYKFKVQRAGDINAGLDLNWSVDTLGQNGKLSFNVGQKEAFGTVMLPQVPFHERESSYSIQLSNAEITDLPENRSWSPEILMRQEIETFTVVNDILSPEISFSMSEIQANRSHRFLYVPVCRTGYQNSQVIVKTTHGDVIFEPNESIKNIKLDFDLSPQESEAEKFAIQLLEISPECEFWPKIQEDKNSCEVILTNDVIKPKVHFLEDEFEIFQSEKVLNLKLRRSGWNNSKTTVTWDLDTDCIIFNDELDPALCRLKIFDAEVQEKLKKEQTLIFEVGEIDKIIQLPITKQPMKPAHLRCNCNKVYGLRFRIKKVKGDNFPAIDPEHQICVGKIKLDIHQPMISFSEEIVQVNRSEGVAHLIFNRSGTYLDQPSEFYIQMIRNESCTSLASLETTGGMHDGFPKEVGPLVFQPNEITISVAIKLDKLPKINEFSEIEYQIYKNNNHNCDVDPEKSKTIVWILNDIAAASFGFQHDKISCKQSNGSISVQLDRKNWLDDLHEVTLKISIPDVVTSSPTQSVVFQKGETFKDLIFELSDRPEIEMDESKHVSYLFLKIESVQGKNFPKINPDKDFCKVEILHEIFDANISFRDSMIQCHQTDKQFDVLISRTNFVGETTLFSYKIRDVPENLLLDSKMQAGKGHFEINETAKKISFQMANFPMVDAQNSVKFYVDLFDGTGEKVDELPIHVTLDIPLPTVYFNQKQISVDQSQKSVKIEICRSKIYDCFSDQPNSVDLWIQKGELNQSEITLQFEKDSLSTFYVYEIDQTPVENTEISTNQVTIVSCSKTLKIDPDRNIIHLQITNDNLFTEVGFVMNDYEFNQSEKKCLIPIERTGDKNSILDNLKISINSKLAGLSMACGTKTLNLADNEFTKFVQVDFPKNPIFGDDLIYTLEILPLDSVQISSSKNSKFTPAVKYGKFKACSITVKSDIEISKIGIDTEKLKKRVKRSDGDILVPFLRSGFGEEDATLDISYQFKVTPLDENIEIEAKYMQEKIQMVKHQNEIFYKIPLIKQPAFGSHESLSINLNSVIASSKPEMAEHNVVIRIENDLPHPMLDISEVEKVETFRQSETVSIKFDIVRSGWFNSVVFADYQVQPVSPRGNDNLSQVFKSATTGSIKFKELREKITIELELNQLPVVEQQLDHVEFQFALTNIMGEFDPDIDVAFKKFRLTFDVLPPVFAFEIPLALDVLQTDSIDVKVLKRNFNKQESLVQLKVEHPEYFRETQTYDFLEVKFLPGVDQKNLTFRLVDTPLHEDNLKVATQFELLPQISDNFLDGKVDTSVVGFFT